MNRRWILFALALLVTAPVPARGDGADDARLARADALRKAWDIRPAEHLYREILREHPDDPDALIGLARTVAAVGEQPRAVRLFLRAARIAPKRAAPWVGLGALDVFLDRMDAARRQFEHALELDPDSAGARAGLARVAIEAKDYARARRELDRARAAHPGKIEVLMVRSELLYRTGEMAGAARCLREARKIEPQNVTVVQRLSNGFVAPDRPPYSPPAVPAEYSAAVARARALYHRPDLDAAAAAFRPLATDDAPDARPDFYLGLIALRRGDLRTAQARLTRALRREPDSPRIGNAFAVAMIRKLDAQRPEYGGDGSGINRFAPFLARPAGPPVAGTERLVPGYDRLLPRERRVVDAALRPFADRIPTLLARGVTHQILGLDEGICDAPERRWLLWRHTVDGRAYRGLRGVGGRNAATGLEALFTAAAFRYDTFAHEFAHQVHRVALTDEERAVIHRLYLAARAEHRCLDFYAASNEFEYFAQGYEAFLSVVKSPFAHYLRRHTRGELRDRDPALFRMIGRLTGTPDPDPALTGLAPAILSFYEWCGDDEALRRARALLAPTPSPAVTLEPR